MRNKISESQLSVFVFPQLMLAYQYYEKSLRNNCVGIAAVEKTIYRQGAIQPIIKQLTDIDVANNDISTMILIIWAVQITMIRVPRKCFIQKL